MIREAHEGPDNQSSPADDATPFTMNGSFFLGEDEGQQDEEDRYSPESEEDEGTNSPHSDDGSSSDSRNSRESESDPYRSANSDANES